MTRLLSAVGMFAATAALSVGVAGFQPPEGGGGKGGGPPGKGDKQGKKGGKGGMMGKRGFQLGTVLPPFIRSELDLTADQDKQVDALEKDVKARLEKILTPDQIKRLDELGPPPGGPGGKGGKEGAPMPKDKAGRPDRPGGGEE